MPYRIHPISEGEIYHIFNRSVGSVPIFLNQRDYKRALDIISYYSYTKPPLRFSFFDRLTFEEKNRILQELEIGHTRQIDLFSFSLMPNHVHFLAKNVEKAGISTFMSNFQNSCAKYFNLKTKRHGALFQSMFKAVRIETEEQLLHVCRYIHLNPYVSFVVKNIDMLENYPWTSLPDYLGKRKLKFLNYKYILDYYSSIKEFSKFTFDEADFRKRLKEIEYFGIENMEHFAK